MDHQPVITNSLRVGTAPDGTRAIQVRSTTTVGNADFRSALDRAMHHCCERRPSAATPDPAPVRIVGATSRHDPSTQDLLRQLRDLIQQLIDRLDQRALGTAPTQHTHRDHDPAAPIAPTQAARCDAGRVMPQRVFDKADGRLVVRGTIARLDVHEGAKLDDGITRLRHLLQQVGDHIRAGGSLSDEQLAAVADEADAIYLEAIRAPTGDGDLGDFADPGRDGLLDLGASSHAAGIEASVKIVPAPEAIECSPTLAA